jgi:hypothetical protein
MNNMLGKEGRDGWMGIVDVDSRRHRGNASCLEYYLTYYRTDRILKQNLGSRVCSEKVTLPLGKKTIDGPVLLVKFINDGRKARWGRSVLAVKSHRTTPPSILLPLEGFVPCWNFPPHHFYARVPQSWPTCSDVEEPQERRAAGPSELLSTTPSP